MLSTLWTESKSYETGNLITVKFVLEANNGKPLNEHYNKARVSLIRKNDGKEREVISSKLVDVVDGQIMHEVFKTSREGRYQFILNYGPIGKETDESEEFSVTTKKSSEPTNESVSSEPTYKKAESSLAPQNISKQKEFSEYLLDVFSYDRKHGLLKTSAHPFTSGVTSVDTRITTRYDEKNLISSIFSTIHELGHAIYEMQNHKKYDQTFLHGGTSLGIHESQSRFYENMIGKSREFWEVHYKKLKKIPISSR